MNHSKEFRKQATYMLVSFAGGFAVQALYFVLLARSLGAAEYGRFAAALAVSAVLSTISGLGAGNVLVMNTATDRSSFSDQLGTSLCYIAASFVPLASVGILVADWSGGGFLDVIVPLLVSELLFTRITDVVMQSFQAHERLRGTAAINVAAAVVRLSILVLLGRIATISSAVAWAYWYALANTTVAIMSLTLCVAQFGKPRLSGESLRRTWRTGVFFSMGMASRIAYLDLDKAILASSGMLAPAGAFAAASRVVTMAFTPIQAVVYSGNTRMYQLGKNGYVKLWRELVKKLMVVVVLYAAVAYGVLLAARKLLPVLLGPDFELTSEMISWLGALLVLQGVHYTLGDALMAVGRQSFRSVSQAAVAAFSVLANILLIPVYGWRAAVGVSLVAAATLAVTLTIIYRRGFARERMQEEAAIL